MGTSQPAVALGCEWVLGYQLKQLKHCLNFDQDTLVFLILKEDQSALIEMSASFKTFKLVFENTFITSE